MQKVAGERYVYRFVCAPDVLYAMAFPNNQRPVLKADALMASGDGSGEVKGHRRARAALLYDVPQGGGVKGSRTEQAHSEKHLLSHSSPHNSHHETSSGYSLHTNGNSATTMTSEMERAGHVTPPSPISTNHSSLDMFSAAHNGYYEFGSYYSHAAAYRHQANYFNYYTPPPHVGHESRISLNGESPDDVTGNHENSLLHCTSEHGFPSAAVMMSQTNGNHLESEATQLSHHHHYVQEMVRMYGASAHVPQTPETSCVT